MICSGAVVGCVYSNFATVKQICAKLTSRDSSPIRTSHLRLYPRVSPVKGQGIKLDHVNSRCTPCRRVHLVKTDVLNGWTRKCDPELEFALNLIEMREHYRPILGKSEIFAYNHWVDSYSRLNSGCPHCHTSFN